MDGNIVYNKCQRCNRVLKSEKAKQRGFGDYCWKLYNLEVKKAKPCLLDTFEPNKKQLIL